MEVPPNTAELHLALADVATQADLTALLNRLRGRAGKPSARTLEKRARDLGLALSKSTAATIINSTRDPTRGVLVAFVRSCGVPADQVKPWTDAWERLEDTPASRQLATSQSHNASELQQLQEHFGRLRAELAALKQTHATELAELKQTYATELAKLRRQDLEAKLTEVGTREELAALLREVRVKAGSPSLHALSNRTNLDQVRLTKSAVADMLAGRRFPRKSLLLAFLRECGVDDDQAASWAQTWERLAVTQRTRPAGDATEPQLREQAEQTRALELTEQREPLEQRSAQAEHRAQQAEERANRIEHRDDPAEAQSAVAQPRPEFDIVMRGYNRRQVDDYLQKLPGHPELLQIERTRDHNAQAPQLPTVIVAEKETNPRSRNASLFGSVTLSGPRAYRVKATALRRGGSRSPVGLPLLLRPNQTERIHIEHWPDDKTEPDIQQILFEFWPPVETDETDQWTCPCGKPLSESGGGRAHWETRLPVSYHDVTDQIW